MIWKLSGLAVVVCAAGCTRFSSGGDGPESARLSLDAWTHLDTIALSGAESAHIDPVTGDLFAGTEDGLVRIGADRSPVLVASGDRLAAVAVADDGAVFWSEDYPGTVTRWSPSSGAEVWAEQWHDGDDDQRPDRRVRR